ncbi:MAG: AraC family transcriptional regulator [Myxococcales bacterium]
MPGIEEHESQQGLRTGPQHTVPAAHALDLAELVESLGASRSALLEGTELTFAQLEQQDARLPLPEVARILERAKELTGEDALGFYLGMHMRVPAHGYLGFAAMTAPTARHALELAVRYAPTRTTALKVELAIEGSRAVLYIDEVVDLGSIRDTLLVALVVGLWRIGEALTGQKLRGEADFTFPEPSYAERFTAQALPVRFGQQRNAVRFDLGVLELPLVNAHPAALRLAQEQCEKALEQVDGDDLAQRVKSVMPKPEGGFRNLDEVAVKLGVSSRTLKRKLKAEGTAFSEVLDAVQSEQACALLRLEQLTIDEVAEKVGYSDVSNFTRAFKRWTDLTPAAYRKANAKRI